MLPARKRHVYLRLLLIALPFVACTSPNMIMNSWVGHTEDQLYRQWGPPTKVIDNGRDGKIVTYTPDSTTDPASAKRYINAKQPPEYISPRNNEYKRPKSFFITPMGNIYAWKWK
jgi:hypothetical protein